MSKRITLLGATLMVIALPLYADIFSLDHNSWGDPSAALHMQIANSLITGTGPFSIRDTRRLLNTEIGRRADLASPTPGFRMNRPVAPVPEPTNYVLMGLGVIGLFLARRDRRNSK
jgi:PEP-CTERM motif